MQSNVYTTNSHAHCAVKMFPAEIQKSISLSQCAEYRLKHPKSFTPNADEWMGEQKKKKKTIPIQKQKPSAPLSFRISLAHIMKKKNRKTIARSTQSLFQFTFFRLMSHTHTNSHIIFYVFCVTSKPDHVSLNASRTFAYVHAVHVGYSVQPPRLHMIPFNLKVLERLPFTCLCHKSVYWTWRHMYVSKGCVAFVFFSQLKP